MLVRNLAKYFDLITVYKKHFNLTLNEDANPDVLFDESDIIEDFLPLFYPNNGNVLFEQMIFDYIDQIKETDNSRTFLIDSILDFRILTNQIIKFYFKDIDISYSNGDLTSIQLMRSKINDLELPHEVKYYLMSFFLDPVVYTNNLIKSMVNIGLQICSLYDNQYKIIADLISSFTESTLSNIAESNKKYAIDINKPIYYSFGILNPDAINFWKMNDIQILYFGSNYKKNIKKDELINIEQLGRILADPSRVKILNYVLLNGPTTVSTVNRIFGYSGTTSYYHLSMMHKAGMLNISSNGRVLCYSVSRKYFNHVLTFFKKYTI